MGLAFRNLRCKPEGKLLQPENVGYTHQAQIWFVKKNVASYPPAVASVLLMSMKRHTYQYLRHHAEHNYLCEHTRSNSDMQIHCWDTMLSSVRDRKHCTWTRAELKDYNVLLTRSTILHAGASAPCVAMAIGFAIVNIAQCITGRGCQSNGSVGSEHDFCFSDRNWWCLSTVALSIRGAAFSY